MQVTRCLSLASLPVPQCCASTSPATANCSLLTHLQSTFAMLNWALRETVTKLLFGKPMLPGPGFYSVSYSLLLIIYLVAILVPSGGCCLKGQGSCSAEMVRGWANELLAATCCVQSRRSQQGKGLPAMRQQGV